MNIKKVIILIIIYLCIPILLNAQYIEWLRRYNGPMTNGDDVPSAITLDANGNIYLAGRSESGYNNSDFITIKYYPNGETAWVRRYNGLGNDFDRANAIVVDNNGNVYVTGMSYISAANSYDWLTVKYDGNGNLIWVKTYNGSGNADDEPKAIALDNTGNVYITGYTLSYDNWYDFTTIKYNKLNGDTIWVRHYDGPVNGYDQAVGIAIDNQNNIYVTGKSDGPDNCLDYATIKYSSNGTVEWVRRYSYAINNNDEPSSITIDNYGNIYVTGLSTISYYNNADCATIKYYPNGDTAWVRRYNGTANDWDEAKDIAVDNYGNVYITGFTYSRPDQKSYLTIKYNSSGTQQWVKIYDLPDTLSGQNEASALDLDNAGNIYVAGTIDNSINGRDNDYGTIRYNPDGTQKWVTLYDNPHHSHDEAVAIAVDQNGNVYVTGTSYQNYNDDIVTIKYYQAGANDVGVDSIIYPPEQHLRLMPMRPCALVKNFGSMPQTNFPVVCSIIGPNNSLRYTNTKIVSYLADYDTVRVYFDTWIPTIRETCTVKMRTNLIGDQDPTNDQKTRITAISKAILILSEGFESTFPPVGWQNVIINGQVSDTWQRKSSNDYPFCWPYEGSFMASYQSCDAPAGSMARLITPPINLGTQPVTCILNFAMFHDPGLYWLPDSVKIEYSTDSINFTQVAAFSRYRNYTPWDERWEEHSVELGTFTGTIYFGILAFSGDGRNMNIDLVQLYVTLPLFNDVAVDEIISPLPNQPAGLPITPIARIKNCGLNAQSNFPVVCSIISASGVLRYTNTQNVPLLASGDTICVNFSSWTPNVEETCKVKIRTLFNNDENPNNDQKTKQIEIGSTLLSEGFESTFPPPGWQSVIVYGYFNWERRTSNENPNCLPYEGSAMASYQSYWAWPPGSMARLISRPITLGPTPVPYTLKFFMYHDPWFQEYPDSVKIEYSTDGTNFTRVAAFARAIPEDSSYWIEHSVYLGTLSGTIYIGILAYSGYGNNMNIDYVRLIKSPQYTNDIGVDAIIQPTSTHT
ncbi:MAG: SBBP repeat-containing protein, partial [candidate division WOR-3 bacterium]